MSEQTKEWVVEVERSQGERRATGTVRVLAAVEPGDGSPARVLAAARAYLELADAAIGASEWSAARAAARAGIDEIGDAYKTRKLEDDTGQHLLLADDELARGLEDKAARTTRGVLDTRARALARTHDLH